MARGIHVAPMAVGRRPAYVVRAAEQGWTPAGIARVGWGPVDPAWVVKSG